MATLVSPGTDVTITDESFYIPGAKSAVPLIFLATASEKMQPNAQPATGTYEHSVVRTITSVSQSVKLYGTPIFKKDANGNPFHGDARNEYGLLALNQYLGIGNIAYVVRANVNLNDDRDDVLTMWERKIQRSTTPVGAAYALEGLVNAFLSEYNVENGYVSTDPEYKTTVSKTELLALIEEALDLTFGKTSDGIDVFFDESTFKKVRPIMMTDHTTLPLPIYANGFDAVSTGEYLGLPGEAEAWETAGSGSVVPAEWTSVEARNFLIDNAADVQDTREFLNATTLGANDAARRVAIAQALQSAINSNQAVRSEQFEYDLIVCPGYPEVADELVALAADIKDEAFVISAPPMDLDPEATVAWAATTKRIVGNSIAYYYPHGLMSNLDGVEVLGCASGIALRTYAYSDSVSYPWFAPAGTVRGLVQGVSSVGYVTGALGGPTTFEELALNQGQRDSLYEPVVNINPITFFPGRGILVWGQKTSQADTSARDRVNVERLLRLIKRSLRKNTMSFIFQPNDSITRANLKAVIDGYLGDILVKRGLYDYVTQCDESNNTGDRIDRNEMYADVALKPTKAAEFLYIPIRVVSTDADI